MSTNKQRLSIMNDEETEQTLFLLNSKLYNECYREMSEATTFDEMNSIYTNWARMLSLAKDMGIMHSTFEPSFNTLMGVIYDRGLELYWLQFDDEGFTAEE